MADAAAFGEEAPPASLADLPDAALEVIFSFCSSKHTMRAIRSVCKRWEEVLADSSAPLPSLRLAPPLQHTFLQRHGKKVVQLSLKRVESLSCISTLRNLHTLALEDCRRLSDASPLTQLCKLHDLLLRNMRSLTDLRFMAQLPELSNLLLDRCAARDLAPLAFAPRLSSLHLGYDCWAVVGLTFPPALPALRRLRVMAPLQDLSPLASYTGLTSLELYAVAVHDLSPLAVLTALRDLDLHHLHEEQSQQDMSVLSLLVNLAALGLQGSDPAITTHVPWRALTTLTRVDLHGSRVSDLSPLKALTGLRSLQLSQARELRDIGALSSLSELQELVLTGSKGVSDLRPILTLTGLMCDGLLKRP